MHRSQEKVAFSAEGSVEVGFKLSMWGLQHATAARLASSQMLGGPD